MPSEVVKTRKITNNVSLELTQDEITAYVVAGVKRDHKDVRDYEMTVEFDRVGWGDDLVLTAVVSGELVK